jgi:cytochrome P450
MFCGHRGADHAKAVLLGEIRAMIKMRKESDEDLQNAKDLLGRLLAAEGSRITPRCVASAHGTTTHLLTHTTPLCNPPDPDTHERLDENQLADELITFLIAGHGTDCFTSAPLQP